MNIFFASPNTKTFNTTFSKTILDSVKNAVSKIQITLKGKAVHNNFSKGVPYLELEDERPLNEIQDKLVSLESENSRETSTEWFTKIDQSKLKSLFTINSEEGYEVSISGSSLDADNAIESID